MYNWSSQLPAFTMFRVLKNIAESIWLEPEYLKNKQTAFSPNILHNDVSRFYLFVRDSSVRL